MNGISHMNLWHWQLPSRGLSLPPCTSRWRVSETLWHTYECYCSRLHYFDVLYLFRGSDSAVRLCLISRRSGWCPQRMCQLAWYLIGWTWTSIAPPLLPPPPPCRPTWGCAVCRCRWSAEQMQNTCHPLVSAVNSEWLIPLLRLFLSHWPSSVT